VAPSRTEERLRRLLAIVPYVVRHPGARMEEISHLFDVPEGALAEDLNLLFLTGLPPYTPADLVEVEIEGGRVWIRMAEHFARPVRLTRAEALALYLRGSELLGAPGLPEADALRSALDKLASSLGPEALGKLQVEVGEAPAEEATHLETVRNAAGRRERLEIDYYSASRDEVTTRRIDPEQVFSAIGNWYVVAWDERSDAERLFRVDRIRAARPTGETFEPRGLLGQGRELYTPSGEDIRVRLRVRPGARWIAEYYAVEEAEERNGTLEVTLPTKDLAWMAKLVLRLGGQAEILEPPELRDLVRRTTQETLGRYR
jgi:proteasome accessory factor C